MSARNGLAPFRGIWIAALATLALWPAGARPAPDDGEPVAVTDVAATALDTPVDVAVLANDSDPEGDLLSLTAVGAPGHGSATVNGALVTYAPAPGFEGVDHFLYTISDGNDHTALGLVTVYVGVPPPPPPVLTVSPAFLDFATVPLNKTKDLVLTVTNDTELPVALSDFFVMDQAAPRPFDATDFEGCRSPGARVLEPGQSCTQKVRFWSVPGAGGASPATMRLFDGVTFEDTLATVALFAATGPPDTGPNLPPVAVEDLAGVAPGFTHLLDAVRNDSDPDHDILRITAVSDPLHGTAEVVSCEDFLQHPAADCVQYVPETGYLGTDALTYSVSDGRGGTASAIFHLAVGNVVPTVNEITPRSGSTAGGQPVRITGSGFVHGSAADFICPGGVFPLAVGQLTDTEILATTPPAPEGRCALRVRTRFGQQGQLAEAYRYAEPPVAHDMSVTTDEDTAVTITLAATDPHGDPLTFSIASAPSHGALSPVTGNQVTYTPATDYHGADSFTFKANDGVLDSNTATVSITVVPVDDVLLAVDDAYTVQQDSTLMSGTVRLEVFQTQNNPPAVRDVIDLDGTVFFLGSHPTRGTGLWRTDGTAQGTTLIKAMTPGHLGRAGKTLFFTSGKELWKSDGTPQGTTLVRDLSASIDTEPFDLRDVGGTLFFLVNMISASGDFDGQELWKSDGTAAGTVLLRALNPGFQAAVTPLYPTSVNGTLFLRAQNGLDGNQPGRFDLWKSDGTPESTVMLKEVNPGTLSFLVHHPNTLVNVDGTLFFAADEPPWHGPIEMDLWKSDGTPEGTVKVKVLGTPDVTHPTDFTNVNGTLFFIVHSSDNATGGRRDELWRSDSTAQGTTLLKTMPGTFDWRRLPAFITHVNGTVFFKTSSNTLWKSDGTPEGTVQIVSAPVDFLASANGTVFFFKFGDELWKTDGTPAGTVFVKDIAPGGNAWIENLTASGGFLLFTATGDVLPARTQALWVVGTSADLLANDLVPMNGMPAVAVVTPPSHGDLAVNPDGTFTYRPAAGFTGADSFTYRVDTVDGPSNVAAATITVTAGPPPTVSVAGASVPEGNASPNATVPVVVTLSGPSVRPVTVGYKTIDDTAKAAQGDYVAAAGTVTFAPGQTTRTIELQVVPDTTFELDERFTVRLTTAAGATVADGHAWVTIVNDDANIPPLAVDDGPFSVLEGDALIVPPPGVLANDADPEQAALTARFVTAPAHGVLFLRPSGGFDYTPGVGYVGPDSFTYVANDGQGDSNVATVSLVVRPRVVVIDVAETVHVTDTIAVDPAVMIEVAETIQVSDGVSVEVPPAPGHEIVTGAVLPGATLTTDTEGDGATPDDVIETTVLTPQGGQVTIDERPAPPPLPTAFTFLPFRVEITAPPGTPGQPLLLTCLLDASVLPEGATVAALAVFRDGVEVGPCAPGAQGAVPDPCVASRQTVNGDPRLAVRTSRASVWTFGVARSTSGLATGTLRPRSGGSVAFAATKIHGQLAGVLAYQKGSEQFLALRLSAFAVEEDGHTAWIAGVGVDGRTFLAYAEDRGANGDVFRLWIRGVDKTADGRLASGQVVVLP